MTDKQTQFLASVTPAAQSAMALSGIPASVTIAQAILESGWGSTGLAVKANNYFGVKAAHNASPEDYMEFLTAEYRNGQRVMEHADFAKYHTVSDSFSAHTSLLVGACRYKPAMAVKDDPFKFAAQLQACGYSTSPTYADSLSKLINQFNLTQYDKV